MAKRETYPDVYENPFYYDVAFSFRDIAKEVDFFEECIKRFSKIKVKRVLDVGCGPSPYMLELIKRGYSFTGLDISKPMLNYSLEKAKKAGVEIEVIHADMRNFNAKKSFDFAFCMLGSLEVETNKELLTHLDSVAACLKKGGLYLLDGCIQFDWTRLGGESWTVIKNGLVMNVAWSVAPLSYVEQKIVEKINLEVIEKGKTKVFVTEKVGKLIFPQEFIELFERNGEFEFVGWFNNFDLEQPLEKTEKFNRPITLLRRK
ncbi:MAG: class I SAM-dependent methyltransferase [Candidatus Bathyarchaeia archaeon]